jgi:general secretion pathway protein F
MAYLGLVLLWTLFWLIPLGGLFYAVYFLTTLPLRRQERARFFLDLVESEVRRGSNVEQAIVRIAQSGDRSIGARFHLLAAHLENGLRLSQALDKVPRFLPPQISEMLKTGEEIGDVKRVLPVCRSLLTEAQAHTTSAFNYLIIFAFVLTPVFPYVFFVLQWFVMPKFMDIFQGMGTTIPPMTTFTQRFGMWLATAQLALAAVMYVAAFCYIGGPHVWNWMQILFGRSVDELLLCIPWRRKRIERNFSAMLALLLDANVPESKALQLAAKSTANRALATRCEAAALRLADGMKLVDALHWLDKTGELRWRLGNAANSPGGFKLALAGWHDALDAKAYQQEQAASQFITTSLVLLNGLMICALIAGLFQVLIELLNTVILW